MGEGLTDGILRQPNVRLPLARTVNRELERRSFRSPAWSSLFETSDQNIVRTSSPSRVGSSHHRCPQQRDEGKQRDSEVLTSTKCLSASPTPLPPPPRFPETVPPLSVELVEPNLKCDPFPPFGSPEDGVAGDWEGSEEEDEFGGPERMKSSAPETTKVENLRGRGERVRVWVKEGKRERERGRRVVKF